MQAVFTQNFEKAITDAIEKYNAPGIVANVVLNKEITYSKAIGLASVGKHCAPITSDTIFSVMSISKSFTATAIMQFVEKNIVLLDEPISTYLPYFYVNDEKYITNPITVKQLLSHTAGFPEYYPIATLQDKNLVKLFRKSPEHNTLLNNFPGEMLAKIQTREDVTRHFSNVKLDYVPGEGWQYCTDAYVIAGDLIEKISGMTWEEYMDMNIFSRLNLNATFTDPIRLNKEENKSHYYTFIEPELIELPTPINRICAPAGFIYSTANDLTKFLIAHMDFKSNLLLNKESLEIMQNAIAKRGGSISYGLGWRIRRYRDHTIVEHAGGYPGVAVYVTMVPEEGFAVVLFSNSDKVPVKHLIEMVTDQFIDSIS